MSTESYGAGQSLISPSVAEMHIEFEKILFGHAAFQFLYAGVRFGIFDLIRERGEATLEEIRQVAGLSGVRGGLLIDGLVSLNLVDLRGGRLTNSRYVAELMRQGRWPLVVTWIEFEARIAYPGGAYFVESLVTGRNEGLAAFGGEGETVYERLASLPDLRERFFSFVNSFGPLAAEMILDALPPEPNGVILDVGGGDGVVAEVLCKAAPKVRIIEMDLPEVCERARARFEAAELMDSISFVPGDFFGKPWPKGVDYVLFVHQLVIWSPEENMELLSRAREALCPGGAVVITNSMLDEGGVSPFSGVMDGVYFASVATGRGRIYKVSEIVAWLEAAGFVNIKVSCRHAWAAHRVVWAQRWAG